MEDSGNMMLVKDSEWSLIEGEACRVIHFSPLASVEKGKIKNADLALPYGYISLECNKLNREANGYITHKIDFMNLWEAFNERTVKEDEEVIVFWTRKNYKQGVLKSVSTIFPKLIVWICNKPAYEIMNDPNYPGLSAEEWLNAIKPIKEWKPDIMY